MKGDGAEVKAAAEAEAKAAAEAEAAREALDIATRATGCGVNPTKSEVILEPSFCKEEHDSFHIEFSKSEFRLCRTYSNLFECAPYEWTFPLRDRDVAFKGCKYSYRYTV